ncbi:hypothetical protein D3C86_1935490 [compost metagenome]
MGLGFLKKVITSDSKVLPVLKGLVTSWELMATAWATVSVMVILTGNRVWVEFLPSLYNLKFLRTTNE